MNTDSEPISIVNSRSVAASDVSSDQLRLSQSSTAHEELHSNKASSLNNLMNTGTKDVTLRVSSNILSTSAPQGHRGQLSGINSTGTQLHGTGLVSAPPPSLQSTSSAVSDSVFENPSDYEDTRGKEDDETDDVFSLERQSESRTDVESSKVEEKEDKNPTFAKMMAEQRRKSEELRSKSGFKYVI